MQGWSYRDTETDGPLWTRPLNRTEEKFFWFAECNARTDLLEHLVITVEGTAPDGIMNRASVTQAWIKVKQLHPLLAAEVTNRSGQRRFVITGRSLTESFPGEVELLEPMSEAAVESLEERYVNGLRRLSSKKLATLSVIPSMALDNSRFKSRKYHVLLNFTHIIADGVAGLVIARTFLESLASTEKPKPLSVLDIRTALKRISGSSSLASTSEARKRWRRAMAWAILRTREAVFSGGQTLPRTVTSRTATTTPLSRAYGIEIEGTRTQRMLSACRANGVTFGHAFIVLKQIAHMKVVHRLRHTMPPDEYNYRTRQPMHFTMPISLRHKMLPDSEGPVSESEPVVMCAGLIACTLLPFSNTVGESILSSKEFWSRCKSVKRQCEKGSSHPLLLELCEAQDVEMGEGMKRASKVWDCDDVQLATIQEYPPGVGVPKNIVANMGSSFGDLEKFLPPTYVRLDRSLEAIGSSSGTWIGGWWDGTAYEDSIVRLWMHEVVDLAKFYLADGGVMEEGYGRQARL